MDNGNETKLYISQANQVFSLSFKQQRNKKTIFPTATIIMQELCVVMFMLPVLVHECKLFSIFRVCFVCCV